MGRRVLRAYLRRLPHKAAGDQLRVARRLALLMAAAWGIIGIAFIFGPPLCGGNVAFGKRIGSWVDAMNGAAKLDAKTDFLSGWGQPPIGGAQPRALTLRGEYIKGLVRNEEAMAELYALFGQRIPSAEAFWATLASEEKAHADVLKKISALIESEDLTFRRPDQFNLADVNECTEKIVSARENSAARDKLTMREALETALETENAVIEANFFNVVERDDPRLRGEFEALTKHTAEHVERIRTEAKRFKWLILG